MIFFIRRFLSVALLAAVIFINVNASAQVALIEKKFFENSLSVLIPSSFKKASMELIEQRYPDANTYPKIVLTNETEEVTLAINITENSGDRESIIHFYRDMKAELAERYPKIRYLKTDVIRNRTLANIEFIVPNKDGENIYNMMAFRYVGKRFAMVNFSAPVKLMSYWQSSARDIAENVKVVR